MDRITEIQKFDWRMELVSLLDVSCYGLEEEEQEEENEVDEVDEVSPYQSVLRG